ncbi:HAD hydrolase-like protein [Leptolyngbya sp. AN02str]|uniref:HAD hydrolase-like protein n=1 Tax=Leptolyngbya sp. AN02str TaxID=3423363 RepID=UPI003D3173F4
MLKQITLEPSTYHSPGATKPVKVVLFDFDGTIADSFDVILALTNRIARDFGYKPASPEQIKQLQNLTSREIIRQSQIPVYKLPFLLRRLKTEMTQEVVHLQPIPGIPEALQQLKQLGYTLGIVTSNTYDNVMIFLAQHGMQTLFDVIETEVTLFGKARVIHQVLRRYRFPVDAVIYVGDETRDVEAARKLRMKMVAVGWGFNSCRALGEMEPDVLLQKPDELVDAIARLTSATQPTS